MRVQSSGPFRPRPAGKAEHYKTYAISQPPETHTRPATCAEAGCGGYANGWRTTVDERTDLGQRQAYYIRRQSGRRFAEHRDAAGLTVFVFEAGQRCFRADTHRVSLERPALFVVRGGDFRGNPVGDKRVHRRADDWKDDFAEHLDRVKTVRERG